MISFKQYFTLVLFLFFSRQILAQQKDSIAVMNATQQFLYAFNHFQWEPFRKSFAKDASIFFPEWDFATRINGRESIEKTWLELFPEFKDNPKKDTMKITPKNISIQLYGNAAVMSFHLGNNPDWIARRTIVWVMQNKEWKIAHLHASVIVGPEK